MKHTYKFLSAILALTLVLTSGIVPATACSLEGAESYSEPSEWYEYGVWQFRAETVPKDENGNPNLIVVPCEKVATQGYCDIPTVTGLIDYYPDNAPGGTCSLLFCDIDNPYYRNTTPSVTEIVPCRHNGACSFSEGLAAVANSHGQWGFIDTTGKQVVPCKYKNYNTDSPAFHDGLARVCVGRYPDEDEKWGFIDKAGKEVVPCKYDKVKDFSDGLAAVHLNRWGFVDTTGKEVVPCTHSRVGDFSEGLAAVAVLDSGKEKWGFIDKTGKEVTPCKYVVPHEDDDIWISDPPAEFHDGFAAVCIDTGEKNAYGRTIYKWGFIDKTGKEVVPCKYDYARSFSEGLAAVWLDGKWGFIDTTGKEVAPCKYYEVGSFSEGLAAVAVRDSGKKKWGFIDKTGKEVVPCTLDYRSVGDIHDGLAVVRNDYLQSGFIDTTGKEVVPLGKYDSVKSFSEGLAAVGLDTGEDNDLGSIFKWGFIDTTGKEVVPLGKYDKVQSFSEGLAAVHKTYNGDWTTGKWGFISVDSTVSPVANTAYASTQSVNVDGKAVTFECYALKDENGNQTNYIKLRDLALLLNGSAAQFQVGWDGSVTITTKTAYTPNGSELSTPYTGDREYQETSAVTKVNGQAANLAAFMLNDDQGGGYTYYQLRDLGQALGFNVGWSADKGVFIETDKPYDANN